MRHYSSHYISQSSSCALFLLKSSFGVETFPRELPLQQPDLHSSLAFTPTFIQLLQAAFKNQTARDRVTPPQDG